MCQICCCLSSVFASLIKCSICFCIIKNKCICICTYITAQCVKNSWTWSVSGRHRELLLCSVKPCASEEQSITSYFPSSGIRALSRMISQSHLNQTHVKTSCDTEGVMCPALSFMNISQLGLVH